MEKSMNLARGVPSDRDTMVPGVTNEPLRPTSICLACGEALAPPLERSASLRCHDCRDAAVPIRPELVPDAARSAREDRVLRAA